MNMYEAAMASMTLNAAPAPVAPPLFAARGAHDLPLLFLVDGANHLQLLRCDADYAWTATDLTAALPALRVCSADVRQAPDGAISLALALCGDDGSHTLRVATNVPATLDEADWIALLGGLAAATDLPLPGPVTRLAFGPLQAGAPPLLLICTAAGDTWYCNAAAPRFSMRPLQLPADVQGACAYTVGSYRLPGVWALRPHGHADELRFASFDDQFGWHVNVAYPNLPARTGSVLLAPGSVPNVPDLFAAGERIVVYRGGHNIPQLVAPVAGARLLWSSAGDGGEYLAYADRDGALWMVARPMHGAWNAPFLLTQRRAVLTAAGCCVYAIARENDGRLAVKRFGMDGSREGCGIVDYLH